MTAATPDSPLDHLLACIAAQRQALFNAEVGELESSSAALLESLAACQAAASRQSADATRIRHAARELELTAVLLQRASAANQRALATLFEPSATYVPPGAACIATPSRPLITA